MPDHNFGDGRTLGEELVWTFTEAGDDAFLAPLMPWYYDYWLANVLQYSTIDPSPVTDVLTSELESVRYDGLVANVLDIVIAAADDIDNNYDVTGGGGGPPLNSLQTDTGYFLMTGVASAQYSADLVRLQALWPDDGYIFSEVFMPNEFAYPFYANFYPVPIVPGVSLYISIVVTQLYDMGIEDASTPSVSATRINQETPSVSEIPLDGDSHSVVIGPIASPPPWMNADGTVVNGYSGIYKVEYLIQAGPSGG